MNKTMREADTTLQYCDHFNVDVNKVTDEERQWARLTKEQWCGLDWQPPNRTTEEV